MGYAKGWRGKRTVNDKTYRYFITYRDEGEATARLNRMLEMGHNVIMIQLPDSPGNYHILINLSLKEEIILRFLDFVDDIYETMSPAHRSFRPERWVWR